MTDLLGCPFCGGDFLFGKEPYDNEPVGGLYYVFHEYGPIGSAARECPISVSSYFGTKEEAALAWNTRAAARAPSPSSAEMLELADSLVRHAEDRRKVATRCYADGGDEDDTPIEEYVEYQAARALRLAATPAMPAPQADIATIKRVIDETFTALGVTDNEAALVEIERLQAAMPAPADAARNWTEHAPHENGNYQCSCHICGQMFIGHKRRVTCKLCAAPADAEPVALLVEELRSRADVAEAEGSMTAQCDARYFRKAADVLAARPASPVMAEWQPIETAPKDKPQLLLGWHDPEFSPGHCGEGYWDDGYEGDPYQPSYSAGWCIPSLNYFNVTCPTHWMPLPAPPALAKLRAERGDAFPRPERGTESSGLGESS